MSQTCGGLWNNPCEFNRGNLKKRHSSCHNLNLGLATKARACKSAEQEGSPGGTSYILGSAREWENEPSHSQVSSHFGSWKPNALLNLQGTIGQNTIWMWTSWKGIEYTIKGRWWLPPSSGYGESHESKFAYGSS